MDLYPETSPIDAAAATLRAIWAEMLCRFGLFGVEPSRYVATGRWCSAIFRKMDQLLARYQAGKLRVYAMKRVVAPGRKIINKPGMRMPRKFAWLVATGTHHAMGYGSQIQYAVLARPEMVELLENCPQAKRILRPLLRALAVALPWTVDKPRAERPRKPRKPRPKPEAFKHPLPRGILAQARRDKALEKAIKARDELVAKMGHVRRG